MTIRKALPDEAAAMLRVVIDAQRHWGYPEDWIRHSINFTISADFITRNEVHIMEESGEVQGFYVLTKDKRKLEELWVAPVYFGTGVGKELFLHAMEETVSQ